MLQKSSDAVADAEGGMDQPGSSLVSGTLMKESGTVSERMMENFLCAQKMKKEHLKQVCCPWQLLD